jgi:hypothetical protein
LSQLKQPWLVLASVGKGAFLVTEELALEERLKSRGTFHDDGTMVCSDQGAVTLDPPAVFTSCHGAWTHQEQRQFAYTALELISDLSGNLVGYLKVRGTYVVSQSGNEYTGTTLAQVLDPDGVVLFSVSVTNAGERIQVELQ